MIALVGIPLSLAIGTLIFVVARSRSLSRSLPPEIERLGPLAPGERMRLTGWESRLRRVLALVLVAYLTLLLGWWLRGSWTGMDPRWILGLLALILLAGAAAQFSERCPRCGYNLGFQARLLLAERCERCGGPFR